MLGQADLLLPNEAEAVRLGGAPDLAAAVRALAAAGLGLVVKRGAQGVLCVAGGTAVAGQRAAGGAGGQHRRGGLL